VEREAIGETRGKFTIKRIERGKNSTETIVSIYNKTLDF